MRKSKILAKLRAGKPARMTMMGYFLPSFVTMSAAQGFDGIWLDLEHNPMDSREVQSLLAFFHLYDIDAMIRPATREKAQLYRYLEDGATGFMIPHVNDVQTVEDLVRAVKFPPIGDRGLAGNGLEANFMLDLPGTRDPLVEHARQETFLFVQLETLPALAAMAQMAQVPGLDGLYVGPADLRLRLNLLPEAERRSIPAVLKDVAAVCQANGKPWGCLPATLDDLRLHIELGSQLLVWGVDLRMLKAGINTAAQEMDEAIGRDASE
jgi:2-keto-3-deoxy-L-rhamnonate aldolase RhmA